MMQSRYQKVAGCSAVFLQVGRQGASPVERDGLSWSADELRLAELPDRFQRLAAMANALALEGLEEYSPPAHGDLRRVDSLRSDFVYNQVIRGWVELLTS